MSFRKKISELAQPADLFPGLSNAQKETNRLLVAIANQIYARRKELGKTQTQLAEQLSVSQSMVCQWESGEYNFSISSLAEIFDRLKMHISISFSTAEGAGVLPNESRYEGVKVTSAKKHSSNTATSLENFPEAA